jgi:glycosyltransferase involved in cell wall biosynthesis
MYCGSCLQGNTLAAALRRAGEDATLVPLYTPLRTDEDDVSVARVAFGGINVFLQEHSALFRHTPWFVDRLLDRPALLRWAARRGRRTRPERLGELTVSMLRGEDGRQRKELDKLVAWLAEEIRPDVVHLNNVLLAGVAREIKRRLRVPVVSTLSGEDIFLEKLTPPHRDEALAVLRERAAELDALVALNGYFAGFMAEYLAVPRERIRVIPPGLNLEGHGRAPERRASGVSPGMMDAGQPIPGLTPGARLRETPGARPSTVIGYFARVCPEKGLHLLAEAFKLLCADAELPPLQLRAAGYMDEAERPYLEEIQSHLAQCGLAEQFEYAGELDRPGKIAFLQSLDLLSVPTVYAESKGLSVLEGWANGVPAVLPAHGAFPELIADTGGGLLCEPHDPSSLAAALKRMILDPQLAAACGHRAQEAVHDRYTAEVMAKRTVELYREVIG